MMLYYYYCLIILCVQKVSSKSNAIMAFLHFHGQYNIYPQLQEKQGYPKQHMRIVVWLARCHAKRELYFIVLFKFFFCFFSFVFVKVSSDATRTKLEICIVLLRIWAHTYPLLTNHTISNNSTYGMCSANVHVRQHSQHTLPLPNRKQNKNMSRIAWIMILLMT